MSIDRSSAALGAAIRIALGAAALSGCGGVVASEPSAPASAGGPAAQASGTAPPVAASTAPAQDAGSGDASVACGSALAAAFPDAGADWWAGGEALSRDPVLVACCTAMSAPEPAPIDAIRASGCCHVEFPGNGPACTPWGPPVPPAFSLAPAGVA